MCFKSVTLVCVFVLVHHLSDTFNNFFFLFLSVRQLHFIPVDLGSPIVHCSVADPYVVIMTAEGVVTMFVLKSDSYMGKMHRLALQKPQIPSVSDRCSQKQTPPLLDTVRLTQQSWPTQFHFFNIGSVHDGLSLMETGFAKHSYVVLSSINLG